MIKELKMITNELIPSVHNLQDVIYIRWLGRDWFIMK